MRPVSRHLFLLALALCGLQTGCNIPSPPSSTTPTATSYSYAGITTAAATGTSTASLTFPSATSTTSIEIQCAARSGSFTTMVTLVPTATSATLSSLQSGTTYTCKAVPVLNGSAYDVGVTQSFQTTSLTSSYYQGALLVQALGDAPTAPSGAVTARQVQITWVEFLNATTQTTYNLVRTLEYATLDATTSTACTSAMTTSCLVCQISGTGAKTCTDTNVATSPAAYDYTVVLVNSGWPEEAPSSGDTDYRITVPIPPSNMVLVQRDAVNYEECNWMGKTTDPLNHQRCTYTGLGGVPYNSGPGSAALGLSTSYFDFGYNLFVDRFGAGCQWGSVGSGAPSGGSDKQVYYDYTGSTCYINVSGTWYGSNSASIPSSYLTLLYTNAPTAASSPTPPLVLVSQTTAYSVCQAVVDSSYGPKRLLRRREFIAAAAWPYWPGEPGALTDTQISSLQNGTSLPSTHACNSNGASGITAAGFGSGDTLAFNNLHYSVMLGSSSTSSCVSRFGAQDLVGNVFTWSSDQLSACSSTAYTCQGTASILDSGNVDFENLSFNGTQGPGEGGGNLTTWTMSTPTYSAANFSLPWGIPLVGVDSGNALSISDTTAVRMHSDSINLQTGNSNGSPIARGTLSGGAWGIAAGSGRFNIYVENQPTNTNTNQGFRCAVPAVLYE